MATDEQALLLQISADVTRLQKNFDKATRIVNDGSSAMERRAKKAAENIEGSFTGEGFAKALDKVFDSSRLTVLEEGSAKLRVFGSALEPLGPAGITAAAGVVALALAVESVKKAVEEVGQLKIDADKVGIPIEALQELQFAAKESHVPVEALNTALANLNDTLGRLRSGVGTERLKALADELGLTPADLANVKTANDLLPVLADHLRALPTLSEQYAAATRAGVADILPLLLKGSGGLEELREEYRSLGVEISGPVADQIEAGNQAMERAHDLAHDKLRNSLLELQPLIVGLSTAWDGFAAHAVDALNATTSAYDRFVQKAAQLANQKSGNGLADLGANLLGRFNLAVARPTTAALALLGNRQAQQEALYGPGGAPQPAAAVPAKGGAAGPTQAQLAAELVAKQKLDELEAKYLTHTTSRLEAEKKIEEINAKRAAAGDAPLDAATQKRILDAASAADAKPGQRAAEAAARKAAEAQRKAQEQAAHQTQAIDSAQKEELSARQALVTNIDDLADLRMDEVDQETKAANDKAAADAKLDAAAKQRIINLNNVAAADKKVAIANQLAAQKAQAALQIQEAGDQATLATLQADRDLAVTAAQRRQLDQQILKIQQDEERARLQAIVNSPTATSDQRDVAAAQLKALPAINAAQSRQLAAQDAGPVEQYKRSIQDLDTLFQNDGVQAIQALSEGLGDAIVNAKSLGAVASSVFKQLLSQVISQAAAVGLTNVLGILHIPGYASGTDFAPGGLALVGEKGPELVSLPRGARVTPNDVLGNLATPRAQPTQIVQQFTFDVSGAVMTQDLLDQMNRIGAAAAIKGAAGGYQQVMGRLNKSRVNTLGAR